MFKKILYTFLLIVLPISAQPHISGNGTSGNPYILYNAADFDSIRYLGVNNKYYELGADIDFTGWGDFTPLPTAGVSGFLSFDGKGYIIKNMTLVLSVTGDRQSSSIFKFSTGGIARNTIKNVRFDNIQGSFSGNNHFSKLALIVSYHYTPLMTLENIEITNSTLTVAHSGGDIGFDPAGPSEAIVGAFGSLNSGSIISDIRVEACSIFASGIATHNLGAVGIVFTELNLNEANGMTIKRISVINSYLSHTLYEYCAVGAIAGIIENNNSSGTITLEDSYSYNNTIYYTRNTSSAYSGFIAGITNNSIFNNVYSAQDTFYVGASQRKGTLFGGAATSSGETVVINDSFAEENGVIPRVGYTHGSGSLTDNSETKTISEMKDPSTFVAWDFDDVWGISEYYQDGYPYLLNEIYLVLQTPVKDQFVLTPDPVVISWIGEGGSNPEVEIYYSLDGGANYTYITNSTSPYNWTTYPETNSITTKIKLVLNGYSVESGNFTIVNSPSITILSPIDSTGIGNVDSSITIKFESSFLTKVFLAYSDNNAGPWLSVVEIPIDTINGSYLDTTSYVWSLPNIQGELWLMISEIADTTIYGFNQPLTLVGRQFNSNAGVICWSHVAGNWIVNYNCLDIACGWASYAKSQWTTLLNDYGTGFNYYKGTSNNSCDLDYFYKPDPVTIDGNNVSIQSFYGNESSTITYKGREYYIDVPTKTVRMNDLLNNINSIYVANLAPFCDIHIGGYTYGWIGCPTRLQLYNVQRSKIEGQSFTTPQDFESLNDPNFTPKILIIGSAYGAGGDLVYSMETLEFPNPLDPVYDTARIFEDLSIRRTLFRGIDPKANKVKR